MYRSDDLGLDVGRARARHPRVPRAAPARRSRASGSSNRPATRSRDVVYAGVEPAALFRSDDGGESFRLVEELWDHEHRPQWEPGGGGLCLHTILPDPAGGPRMAVAVSAAGFYRTLDGTSWEAANTGIKAPFLPEPTPEFGQCVHKVDRHPSEPDTLFLQHHWGVYRSDDFGGEWREIGADALPSTFGFPVVADPEPAGHRVRPAAHVRRVPLHARRPLPGLPHDRRGRQLGAGSMTACRRRTPGSPSCATASRPTGSTPPGCTSAPAPATCSPRPTPASTWTEVARHLPPVVCVKTAVLG